MKATRRLRVNVVASNRHPIAEPFAGGMESHTWTLARGLQARGHAVRVHAGAGSDPSLGDVHVLDDRPLRLTTDARCDASMPPESFMRDHHAYQRLMLRLAADPDVDVVHNNSLHYLPVAMAATLRCPAITTLHTPPTPWLESAAADGSGSIFVAVSAHTANRWSQRLDVTAVIANGIDLDRWPVGDGSGGFAVWSGRLVPEKGAHLAVRAAASVGIPLLLAGPAPDPTYLHEVLEPALGPGARWVGHLDHSALARLVGAAAVAVVTPCWDEPYGLVVAEALSTGTPVAAFARGAVPELLTERCGTLAEPDDVAGLAAAIQRSSGLCRADARAHALATCSAERMIGEYEALYRSVA
jgi:glycosyltransferase involved in cell wall biosynthesis